MHIICNLTTIIDYCRSTFIISQFYNNILGDIEINSVEDLINKRKKLETDNPDKIIKIEAKDIFFTNSFDKKLNLFEIGNFDNNYYINEQLFNALNEVGITGFSALKAENIHITN